MAAKPQLKVVFYQVGTPSYAFNLAVAIFVIVENYKKELSTYNEWTVYSGYLPFQ